MKILLFHAHNGDPLSWLIKAVSRSAYCHAAVLVEEPAARDFVISETKMTPPPETPVIVEAYYPHVRARTLGLDEAREVDVVAVSGLTGQIISNGVSWALQNINGRVDYGISDLFRFTAPGRVVLGEDSDESYLRHTICSQFAFNVFRFGGLRLLNCHDYEVRPDQLLWSPFCRNLGRLSDYLQEAAK